jgi:cytochrome c oxidase assembly protein subunit 15
MPRTARAFERFAWLVLVYGIFVIIWGAVVRATGSGAGCGAHWPLCNGDVVPIEPRVQTVIEFVHRSTSGVILILTMLLVWFAHRTFPAGHVARRASIGSMIFVLIEAAVGAGIVLLRLVEDNASALRAGYIAAHLMNTLVLVGMYTWTVFAARPRPITWTPITAAGREPWMRISLSGMLVVAAAGAVVALGDTLFPPESVVSGFAADLDATSHFLVRLRIWHPLLAVALSIYLMIMITQNESLDEPTLKYPARAALWLILAQVALGIVNILALAPLPLQMAHLLASNLLWLALVWAWLLVRGAVQGTERAPAP